MWFAPEVEGAGGIETASPLSVRVVVDDCEAALSEWLALLVMMVYLKVY